MAFFKELLEHDFKTLGHKQNEEGFEQFLNQTLSSALGVFVSSFVSLRFHHVLTSIVAQVNVRKSSKPIYVAASGDDVLYTRNGNLTEKVPTRQIVDYCKIYWPQTA